MGRTQNAMIWNFQLLPVPCTAMKIRAASPVTHNMDPSHTHQKIVFLFFSPVLYILMKNDSLHKKVYKTTAAPTWISFLWLRYYWFWRAMNSSGPSLGSLKVVVNISNPLIKDHMLIPVEPHLWQLVTTRYITFIVLLQSGLWRARWFD